MRRLEPGNRGVPARRRKVRGRLPAGPREVDVWRDDRAAEPFRDLALRHRGRAGLTRRELATRVGASVRTVQDWEVGVNRPGAALLRALIAALLAAGGLSPGREEVEARALWAAV